jgi:transcriptional regulator with XRE-family HTH domain
MNGDVTNIEDIVRRNVATLRSKANLTQQALADEMLARGVPWTRETVAQVETTNRRLGFTEAIAVAASLDVPLARLTATGADVVAVGDSEWTTPYLSAAVAGTAGDIFAADSYSYEAAGPVPPAAPAPPAPSPPAPDRLVDRRGRGSSRRRRAEVLPEDEGELVETGRRVPSNQRTAERIERRMRLRVTPNDVDTAAQHLWSRSLESERERRVSDRHARTGGSLKTIRGHVSRDLDRELAHEMERNADVTHGAAAMTPEEAAWEATRLNIILANKGYADSDVTRWWNFTRHRELDEQTVAEAWEAGHYTEVSRLIQSLPDLVPDDDLEE